MKDKFYVPFQIAEMLKEKGYPQDFAHNDALYTLPKGGFYWALDVDIARRRSKGEPILAPTYCDVLDWFEEKGIIIESTKRWTENYCYVWYIDRSPVWNWDHVDYRVKEEEPTHRPYENKNEFLVDSMNNGFYIRDKKTNARFLSTCVLAGGIEMMCHGECISFTWKKLFEKFTWDNGYPCGTKK